MLGFIIFSLLIEFGIFGLIALICLWDVLFHTQESGNFQSAARAVMTAREELRDGASVHIDSPATAGQEAMKCA